MDDKVSRCIRQIRDLLTEIEMEMLKRKVPESQGNAVYDPERYKRNYVGSDESTISNLLHKRV
jgi:hypothetical protein